MKRRTIALFILAALFLILFAARFAYELSRSEGSYQGSSSPVVFQQADFEQNSSSFSKRNYASAKIAIAQPTAPTQILDQKYEQVADLSATTKTFDEDAKRLKEAAAEAKALVQSEDSYGLPGSRFLSMSFGVVPGAFDSSIAVLSAIGKLESITVGKKDRTADYKALEARRLSLEKTRDGLAALRRAGAALADLVALETKILEIEGQIQELGVSLGDFSEGNSFCTVNASLKEAGGGGFPWKRIMQAALDALGWSVLVCLGAAAACLAAAGAAALGALAVGKYRELAGRRAE